MRAMFPANLRVSICNKETNAFNTYKKKGKSVPLQARGAQRVPGS